MGIHASALLNISKQEEIIINHVMGELLTSGTSHQPNSRPLPEPSTLSIALSLNTGTHRKLLKRPVVVPRHRMPEKLLTGIHYSRGPDALAMVLSIPGAHCARNSTQGRRAGLPHVVPGPGVSQNASDCLKTSFTHTGRHTDPKMAKLRHYKGSQPLVASRSLNHLDARSNKHTLVYESYLMAWNPSLGFFEMSLL